MTELQQRRVRVPALFGTLAATVVQRGGAATDATRPVVVVWPSVLSTGAVQAALVAELARDATVVAVDPPGHADSRIEDVAALSMAACADATWDLLGEAIGPATECAVRWVGTSWGGLVGLEAARAHTHRIDHLACLNTPFAFEPPTVRRPAWLPVLARLAGTTRLFAAITARRFFLPATRRGGGLAAAAMTAHRATFVDGDRRQLAAALDLLFVRREDARALLAATTTPVLVIAGARDAMYRLEDQRRAAERCPRATFEVVESAHIAAVDATAAVAALLRNAWSVGHPATGAAP